MMDKEDLKVYGEYIVIKLLITLAIMILEPGDLFNVCNTPEAFIGNAAIIYTIVSILIWALG